MAKVVYLLGAGASRGTRDYDGKEVSREEKENNENHILTGIPLVSEIPQRLRYIINILSSTDFLEHKDKIIPLNANGGTGFTDAQNILIKDLQWLADESSRHATIDTFAKKLYLTGDDRGFIKLEKLLTIFFIIEQYLNNIDGRYDTYLANILTNKIEIPDDIAILTWNYDSQFEIAFREYKGREISSPSEVGVCSEYDDGMENNCSRPKIFKLNGSASFNGFYSLGHWCQNGSQDINNIYIDNLLDAYWKDYNSSKLSFAWDNRLKGTEKSKWFWNVVNKEISSAKTLVVIGYTFPFFNREVDRSLFTMMPNLDHIYIQDPNAAQLKNNILPVLSDVQKSVAKRLQDKITIITNCDQFYLPPEL